MPTFSHSTSDKADRQHPQASIIMAFLEWLEEEERFQEEQVADTSSHLTVETGLEEEQFQEGQFEKVAAEGSEWMTRLEACVREHMAESQFSIDELAKLMEVGRKELYRNIRAQTGLSANQYIQGVRLLAAREKLDRGEATNLSELAKSVGFQTANYLSRLYRQRFGKSPIE